MSPDEEAGNFIFAIQHVERHLKKNARHKHMLLLLNKCDLVPAWVTKR